MEKKNAIATISWYLWQQISGTTLDGIPRLSGESRKTKQGGTKSARREKDVLVRVRERERDASPSSPLLLRKIERALQFLPTASEHPPSSSRHGEHLLGYTTYIFPRSCFHFLSL
jgi:hypothetical protein